jgi:hypothetical protein
MCHSCAVLLIGHDRDLHGHTPADTGAVDVYVQLTSARLHDRISINSRLTAVLCSPLPLATPDACTCLQGTAPSQPAATRSRAKELMHSAVHAPSLSCTHISHAPDLACERLSNTYRLLRADRTLGSLTSLRL